MKKTGILNAELMCELTKMRHQDTFVICDAGFPIPKGGVTIDVSLIAGVPTFSQTLKAVLNEIIVEEYVVFDKMSQANPEYYELVTGSLVNQKHSEVAMPEFIELAKSAKLFIRTGELKPCSNILLKSATGVRAGNEKFDVSFDVID